MELWTSPDAWQLGGENLYRHKDAQYFLPSEDEWYKAAYYNPGGANYFDYPTGSDTAPTRVASGTNAGTAVYNNATNAPAEVNLAGGLSPYGTMGQGGNVWEWNETAFDGTNNSGSEKRVFRGGYWSSAASELQSSYRDLDFPSYQINSVGFRVASAQPATAVPEPGTWAAAALLAVGAAFVRWRKRTGSNRSPERPGARG
jgi:formylglycine-generating enzyme required for sulfatase activity